MNALEEIQTAIEKLTELRANSTPGPWENETPFGYAHREFFHGGEQVGTCDNGDDAALIVTLHATIDAQLGLLRAGLNHWSLDPEAIPNGIMQHSHYLAISINGAN